MRVRKFVFAAVFFIAAAGYVNAQQNHGRKTGFEWDKVVYGGSIMPSFSNFGMAISANPFVGYKVTERLIPGVMVSYQYVRYNNYPANGLTSIYNLVGVGPFVRYMVYNGFFAQAEYEFLNGRFELKPIDKVSFSENNLFVGGGYINSFGGNSGIYAQIMYNATWDQTRSVYSSPWVFRVGFTLF